MRMVCEERKSTPKSRSAGWVEIAVNVFCRMSLLPPTADACVATFSKPPKGVPYQRVVLSAQRTDSGWRTRIERFTSKQSFTDPAGPLVQGVEESIELLLQQGWRQALLQTPQSDVHVLQTTKGGSQQRTVRMRPPSRKKWVNLTEDREKFRVLTPEADLDVLVALEICTADGTIKNAMADKFRQINHLVSRIVDDLGNRSTLSILDLGCGKAYLSLALYHVLQKGGVAVRLHGVDTNTHVIHHCTSVAQKLFMENATFSCLDISDIEPQQTDVVLALHACNTATDQAIVCALACAAEWIYLAPCCHHAIQTQLKTSTVPVWARPLLDDGITRERLGDLLTDTLRRDTLRGHGYRAHLEEFVSLEHTQKNILLRAHKIATTAEERAKWLSQVQDMCAEWGVQYILAEQRVA